MPEMDPIPLPDGSIMAWGSVQMDLGQGTHERQVYLPLHPKFARNPIVNVTIFGDSAGIPFVLVNMTFDYDEKPLTPKDSRVICKVSATNVVPQQNSNVTYHCNFVAIGTLSDAFH